MWSPQPLYLVCLGIIGVFSEGPGLNKCSSISQQDVIIVLDSSTSIARKDFRKQLKFINDLIDDIRIGPDANQIGVISFSDNYRLNFHLNANRATGKDEKKALQKQVTAIRQMGGGTNTHKPLEYAKRYMFTAQRGDRADKSDVCVVITDGQSYDAARTAAAAKALSNKGVMMFALGVGPKVDEKELLAIASGNKSNVFRANSFDELESLADKFSRDVLRSCPEATTPAPSIPPPVITGMPQEPVEDNAEISLRCSSETTDAAARLQWRKNGVIVPRTTYSIEGKFVVSYYKFPARLADDGKNIDCVLSHPSVPAGLTDTEKLRVLPLPGAPIITPLPEGPVRKGTRVTLTCVSEGTDRGTKVLWYRDNSAVDRSYTISGGVVKNDMTVTATEAREYECRVTHRQLLDDLVAVHTLQVYQPPDAPVIKSPSPTLAPDSPVALTCTAQNADGLTTLVWVKGGRVLDSTYELAGSVITNEHRFASIAEVTGARCEVRHKYLNEPLIAFPEPIVVVVLPGPPEINGGIRLERQVVGTKVTLRCTSYGTDKDTKVFWYIVGSGTRRSLDTTYNVEGDSVVNTMEVRASDAVWTYECAVTHPRLQQPLRAITTIPIFVLPGPPEITGSPSSAVSPGATVSLVCRSKGTHANTSLVWFKNGQQVDTSYAVSGDSIVNEYEFAASKDGDRLECRLSFPPTGLQLLDSATIRVQDIPGKPRITGVPEDSVVQRSTVRLVCLSKGTSPETRLVWYDRSGAAVDSSYRVSDGYVINEYEFSASTVGLFQLQCRMTFRPTNLQQTATATITVHKFPSPVIEQIPSPVEKGSKATLICRVKHNGNLLMRLEWYQHGDVVDQSYVVENDYIVNRFEIVATSANQRFECRLTDGTRMVAVPHVIDMYCATGGAKMDVVIIIDSSTSLSRRDFQKQIEFISSFVGSFDIGPNNVRVGLMSFSTKTTVNFQLNDFNNKEALQDAIASVRRIGGGTNTHLPIQRAREEMFTLRNGDRPGVDNRCIVITDGISYTPTETKRQADLARAAGIDLHAIGIGRGVDIAELVSIAGDRSRVYYANDYSSLKAIETKFVADTRASVGPCPQPTTPAPRIPTRITEWGQWTPCSKTCGNGVRSRSRRCVRGNDRVACPQQLLQGGDCIVKVCESTPAKIQDCISLSHKADIAFLLDTSSSVYQPDFEKMKMFLADFIDLFNISDSGQRIASLTFSDDVRVNFYLKDFHNNRDIKQAFLKIPMHLGGTRTHEAIKFARYDIFSETNGARKNSAKLAFIITDGKSYDPGQTAVEAELARKSGIIIYSIGIGPETDQAELQRIAGEALRVYHVESYDDINKLKKKIGLELGRCYNPLAPINGGYGPWGPYSTCSVTCGHGTKTRKRVCDSPVPRNGGKDCEGMSTRTKRCKKPSCSGPRPTQGWTDWEFSSSCSVTCGEGTQEVTRVCQYADGCRLGEVERKTIKCRLARCQPSQDDKCGGEDGLNVMFASQGINSNGPHSYFAIGLIANATAKLAVDGNRVRTSLTLSDCSCGKNTGYDLTRYRNYQDIYNHLHALDLGDTASLLRKVKSANNIMPSMVRARAFSDNRKQVLVYMFDSNDVITADAISEANKMKLAGVSIYAAVLDKDVDLGLVRQIVSMPENVHLHVVTVSDDGGKTFVDDIYKRLCKVGQ